MKSADTSKTNRKSRATETGPENMEDLSSSTNHRVKEIPAGVAGEGEDFTAGGDAFKFKLSKS